MTTYGTQWHAYETAAKADPAWQKLNKQGRAEQMGRHSLGMEYYEQKATRKAEGKEYARMLALENQKNKTTPQPLALVPASNTAAPTAVVADVMETVADTNNNGIKVAKKWGKGNVWYLADKSGKFYKVDKNTYNAASVGKWIKPIEAEALEFDNLPKEVQNQFRKFLSKAPNAIDPPKIVDVPPVVHPKIEGLEETLEKTLSRRNLDDIYGEALNRDYHFRQGRTDIKRAIGKTLEQRTRFTPELLDDLSGLNHHKTPDYQGLRRWMQQLQDQAGVVTNTFETNIINSVNNTIEQNTTNIINNMDARFTSLTSQINILQTDNDELRRGITTLIDKVDDLSKRNRNLAIIGGLLTVGLGALAYCLGKKSAEKAVPPTPPPPTVVHDTVYIEREPVVDTPESFEKNPMLNDDGTFTVGSDFENGTFWGVAKQNLEWKYRNEPDKFENLSANEKRDMIEVECHRLLRLNGRKADTVYNKEGKMIILPVETIHPDETIKVVENM